MTRRFVVIIDVPDQHPVRTLRGARAFVSARINRGMYATHHASIHVYSGMYEACTDWSSDEGAFTIEADRLEEG